MDSSAFIQKGQVELSLKKISDSINALKGCVKNCIRKYNLDPSNQKKCEFDDEIDGGTASGSIRVILDFLKLLTHEDPEELDWKAQIWVNATTDIMNKWTRNLKEWKDRLEKTAEEKAERTGGKHNECRWDSFGRGPLERDEANTEIEVVILGLNDLLRELMKLKQDEWQCTKSCTRRRQGVRQECGQGCGINLVQSGTGFDCPYKVIQTPQGEVLQCFNCMKIESDRLKDKEMLFQKTEKLVLSEKCFDLELKISKLNKELKTLAAPD